MASGYDLYWRSIADQKSAMAAEQYRAIRDQFGGTDVGYSWRVDDAGVAHIRQLGQTFAVNPDGTIHPE
jgi:hypothetical protein